MYLIMCLETSRIRARENNIRAVSRGIKEDRGTHKMLVGVSKLVGGCSTYLLLDQKAAIPNRIHGTVHMFIHL